VPRVMGIDQSLTTTGWAIVETNQGPGTETVLATGLTETDASLSDDERARCLAEHLAAIVASQLPELIGLEGVHMRKNAGIALKLGALRGALQADLYRTGTPVVVVNNMTRQASLGICKQKGKVKQNSKDAVAMRYGLDCSDHESDAIGIALGAVTVQRREAKQKEQPNTTRRARKKPAKRRQQPAHILACMPEADREAYR
jgi:Holliday junction resolvasome RuvABC endonuclease subunit